MNAIKHSIKSGRTVVGTAGAPNIDVSILADADYDFLLFALRADQAARIGTAWDNVLEKFSVCR